jgi:hypothetical protein
MFSFDNRPVQFVVSNSPEYEAQLEREAMTEIRTAWRAAAITRDYQDRRPSEPEKAAAPKPDFWGEVDKYQKATGCKRGEAIRHVVHARPDLHQAWLESR